MPRPPPFCLLNGWLPVFTWCPHNKANRQRTPHPIPTTLPLHHYKRHRHSTACHQRKYETRPCRYNIQPNRRFSCHSKKQDMSLPLLSHTDSLASGPECYPNFKHPWIWTAEWMGMASKRGVMYVCICMFVASLLNKCAHKYVCTWSQQSKTWRLLIPAGPTWVPWSSCTWLVSTKSAMILRALEGKPSTAYTAL